jgi:ribosomal protein L22
VSPKEQPPRDEGPRDDGAKLEAEAADAKHADAKAKADDAPPEQEAVEDATPEEADVVSEGADAAEGDAADEEAAEGDAADDEAAEGDAAEDEAAEDEAAEDDDAEDEAAEDEAAGAEAEAKPAKRGRRRGSAETAPAAPKKAAPRGPDGAVVIRARARYVRSAPRKARLVMDHIRGRPVEQARAVLAHTPRAASADILKLLESALANAEANYELAADELRVERAFVDEGPIIKRYRPRALGRATRINKRTSHMTIELTTTNSEGA